MKQPESAYAAGSSSSQDPLLIVLLGPTASGKTSLSLDLAEGFNGEIVSCDSVAVYRGFEIGTAKPSPAERKRIPHHLIDVVAPTEQFTAGDYSRLARAAIAGIHARGHVPIVVGGTGLYLRALVLGLFAGPARSEELRQRLRERLAAHGPEHLHRVLRKLDPAAAATIHANDAPKVIRAIEVCLSARKSMTQMWQAGRDPLRGFRILRIGLNPDRDALYQRINARAQKMFAQGLLEETKMLMAIYGQSAGPLSSLGYKQAAQFLAGEVSREQAIIAAQQGHRNYAKRQMTWFRREPDVEWINGFGDDTKIQQEAVELVSKALA
jgi:tRNA dimethylallyltransferase